MAEAAIPVDLLNPGQVFACLGFMEAAESLLGEAEAAFDWTCERPGFRLRAAGGEDPFARVLRFLAKAEVISCAPHGSANATAKWGVETDSRQSGAAFPFPDPASPATLPALLRDSAGHEIVLEHWGDATRRDNVKFWAGAAGYPGAALARDALDLARPSLLAGAADPFALTTPQSSSFRFDWRRDYIPIDAGFSPNDQRTMVMAGFPVVELLAAVGLTHARPVRLEKLRYRYAAIGGERLPPALVRAALGAATSPVPAAPFRRFAMRLSWPGQEGQARCITDVFEETAP